MMYAKSAPRLRRTRSSSKHLQQSMLDFVLRSVAALAVIAAPATR